MAAHSSNRLAQGIFLALGAPAGWLGIQALRGSSPAQQLRTHFDLYLYLFIPTAVAFGVFGMILGRREDVLDASRRHLEELSVTDELTGLKNLRYFRARLHEAFAEAARTGMTLSLAVIDLDHFKRINDRYGHQVGDDLLQVIGHAIASVARAGETAARVGGEEFALLLPGVNLQTAASIGERLRHAIKVARLGEIGVTTSVGVASTEVVTGRDEQKLYGAADNALYGAKRNGRDQVGIWQDPSAKPGYG